MNQVREELETEFREKCEDLANKSKREKEKAVEKAVEKVRADLRNQLDSVKNEFAKAKADWARDRKRIVSDHESALSSLQKESEIEKEAELRAQKEKIEKQWRKKLDDREKALEERISEVDTEMNNMRQRHNEDIRFEKERTENRVRENIRQELRTELTQEMQSEFEAELLKTQNLHKAELHDIKR